MAKKKIIAIEVIYPSTEEGKKILDDAIDEMMKNSISAATNNMNVRNSSISLFSTNKKILPKKFKNFYAN